MLHLESGKDRQENHRAVVLVGIVLLLLITACGDITSKETEAERVARIREQLLVDSAQDAQLRLGQFISASKDSIEADHLVNDYYSNGGEWAWVGTDTSRLFDNATNMASFLEKRAEVMGFSPKAFFTEDIRQHIDHLRRLDFDSAGISPTGILAQLEWNLSRAFIRYALGQRFGFVEPHKAFNHLDKRPEGGHRIVYDIDLEQPDSDFVAKALINAQEGHPVDFLQSLEPTDALYRQMAQMLTTDTTTNGRKRLLCNMERRRWRHKQKPSEGQRHVFVNIAAQQLWAIHPDSVLTMRICCGAWRTKTPLLTSNIRLIQVNPEWNIPGSILRNEVSRHGGDSAYFARNRYFIIRRSTGDTIPAKNVSPEQLRSGAYRVAQHSGRGNSLGRLIFRFPNQFDVYLHDTNSRGTFKAERRTVSHGCVRVQKPFELACFLIPDADEWLLDRIRLSIDMKPESQSGRNYLKEHAKDGTPIRLINSTSVTPNVPLEIDYYTLYPNPETGEWETWPDRYEYDKQILRRLKPYIP
ncbi:MAG: L,D-transpeptidase family protein [Prevotella sp.]|nr:L,D-transpeptidase family protein [Prevotella sp.]